QPPCSSTPRARPPRPPPSSPTRRSSDLAPVTLAGPGGAGKTRLAIQVAAELVERFEGGAWFVSLAEVGDPALVVPVIAQALGVRSEEHTSELQSRFDLVCRLLLEKKKAN